MLNRLAKRVEDYMPKKLLDQSHLKTFEQIRHVEDGMEYWLARELGLVIDDHFADVS